MKKIFVMAALSLAAISCTKSDVLDSPVLNQKISFNTYLGKAPQVKAAVMNENSMSNIGFNVVAFREDIQSPYMNVVLTAEAGENNALKWDYEGDCYWPTDGSNLTFGSYGLNVTHKLGTDNKAVAMENPLLVAQENSSTIFTYTVPSAIADQQDLLVAAPVTQNVEGITNNEATTKTVTLNYNHLLSRIGFSAKSNVNKDITITKLALSGTFVNKATVNIIPAQDQNQLVLSTETTDEKGYAVIETKTANLYVSDPTASPKAISDEYLMILPQPIANNVKITGQYQIAGDDQVRDIEIVLNPAEGTKVLEAFAAGKAYQFVLSITTDRISFDVNVNDWDEASSSFEQEI